MSMTVINDRLDLVEEMAHFDALREHIVALLRRSSDTLRLLQKFSFGRGDADDLLGLAKTVHIMKQVSEMLHGHISVQQDGALDLPNDSGSSNQPGTLKFLQDMLGRLDLQEPIKAAVRIQDAVDEEGLDRKQLAEDQEELEAAGMTKEVEIAEEAGTKIPQVATRTARRKVTKTAIDPLIDEIWIMRRTASSTLERAHVDLDDLVQARRELTVRLRQKMKTESLTLKWSSQLGHYCHMKSKSAKANMANIEGARSVGSTKSTQSFYLSEWTQLGVRIDAAKRHIRLEEDRVFDVLRALVIQNLVKLRRNAAVLDELDVACSSAVVATERSLVRPVLTTGTSHHIVGGRHPMVDVGLREHGRQFTANDCAVGSKEMIYLITGPNMGGKSTYLRQSALITILAQVGCFVPADYAEIGLVDKVFSRVGSADDLYHDQSTFMVEMLETAEILKQATPRSFVIMDEVGRGTTPEDGVAVGYACLYHLHNINRCRTLFATHFHALVDMTRGLDRVGCYCTDVAEEDDGSWSFVHRMRRGVNTNSHALKVAQLAGLPVEAIAVAAEVLSSLKQDNDAGKRDSGRGAVHEEPMPRGMASAAG